MPSLLAIRPMTLHSTKLIHSSAMPPNERFDAASLAAQIAGILANPIRAQFYQALRYAVGIEGICAARRTVRLNPEVWLV